MIGLRPIRSDSEPKKMKNGVPRISEIAMRMLVVEPRIESRSRGFPEGLLDWSFRAGIG